MKKIAALCVAVLGAALLVLGTAPSASAYPDLSCDLQVDHQRVGPGETFTATGTATATDEQGNPIDDAVVWTFTWNGETVHRTGSPVHATFTAPEVDSTRVIRLTGRATTTLGPCVHHIDITVIGPSVAAPSGGGGGAGGGLLPNTGGPAFWVLVAAVLLLLGGGGALVASRRRI